MGTEYINAGFKLKGFYQDDTDLKIIKAGNNFKDTVEVVEAVWDDHYNLCRQNVINAAFAAYPFLDEAIKQLGFEEIRNLKFVATNIKRKLVKEDDSTSQSIKILKSLRLNSSIRKGDFIESSKLKVILTKIYSDIDTDKAPKATDILTYYEAKRTKKNIEGKTKDGFIIIREKFHLKDHS